MPPFRGAAGSRLRRLPLRHGPVSRETIAAAVALLLSAPPASAATAAGSSALALAALVARQSPSLTRYQKRTMELMLAGNLAFAFPPGKKILVEADGVTCRASDVDLTLHSCELGFGKATVALGGREAHELFATLEEAGVPPAGAAGSRIESLAHLGCTIDPNAVKARAGGGADCKFDAVSS
jgi:hypothetical protein